MIVYLKMRQIWEGKMKKTINSYYSIFNENILMNIQTLSFRNILINDAKEILLNNKLFKPFSLDYKWLNEIALKCIC